MTPQVHSLIRSAICLFSRARHLPVPAPLSGCVVSPQHAVLALVRGTERITSLLPHALHLAHLADGFLELLHARAVVLDVVLLDLLHVVIRLRQVHALGILPGEVAQETDGGQEDVHGVEDWGCEEAAEDADVLGGEVGEDFRHDRGVEGHEAQPDKEATGDGDDGVLGPDVGDECCLAEDDRKHGSVESQCPDPVASNFAVRLWQVVEEDGFGQKVCEQGMVEPVADPCPEGMHFEEGALHPQLVELGIAVQ